MKLRLTNKAALALLAIVLTFLLDGIIAPKSDLWMLAPIGVSLAYLSSLIPDLAKAYLQYYWPDKVVSEYGQILPLRKVRCSYDNGMHIVDYVVNIVGVESEVTKDTEPSMFGLNPFVDYVVHIEDLLLDDDDLIDLVNETYGQDYFMESK